MCSTLGEGYRKRRYPAHFVSKVSDADLENTETQVWLDFALACNYFDKLRFSQLIKKSEEIGKLLNHILLHP